MGAERIRTGHLSENLAAAGWAAAASDEAKGAWWISLGSTIVRGEDGDGEEEVAPRGLPRGRNGGGLVSVRPLTTLALPVCSALSGPWPFFTCPLLDPRSPLRPMCTSK